MKHFSLNSLFREESGVLTQEWILLLFLLSVGSIAGLTTVRDTINLRFFYAATAIGAADSQYEIYDYKGRNNQYVAEGSSHMVKSVAKSKIKTTGAAGSSNPDAPGSIIEKD